MILIDLDCFYFLNETPTRITRQTHGHSHGFREPKDDPCDHRPQEMEDKSTFGGLFQRGEVVRPRGPKGWKVAVHGNSGWKRWRLETHLWGQRWTQEWAEWSAANANWVGPKWSEGPRILGYPTRPCWCIICPGGCFQRWNVLDTVKSSRFQDTLWCSRPRFWEGFQLCLWKGPGHLMSLAHTMAAPKPGAGWRCGEARRLPGRTRGSFRFEEGCF